MVQGRGDRNRRRTKNSKESSSKIPLGKSHIDFLPDDILYNIYKFKHQLEFKPTLDVLSKLKLAVDSEIIDTKIPIKKLLEKATDKKHIYIDVLPFCSISNQSKNIEVQREFNTSKIEFHHGLGAFCQIEIKFKDKINLLIIDILHLINQLGLTKRLSKKLVDIEATDVHHKTSCIRFKLE